MSPIYSAFTPCLILSNHIASVNIPMTPKFTCSAQISSELTTYISVLTSSYRRLRSFVAVLCGFPILGWEGETERHRSFSPCPVPSANLHFSSHFIHLSYPWLQWGQEVWFPKCPDKKPRYRFIYPSYIYHKKNYFRLFFSSLLLPITPSMFLIQ